MRLRSNLRTWAARRLGMPEVRFAVERLAAIGFCPSRVCDVGAYQGDFARLCLEIWPACHVTCFEALEHRVKNLEILAEESGRVKVVPCLVGATSAPAVPLHTSETASSILSEHHDQGFRVRTYPMHTLDEIMERDATNERNLLLKIDVQGYELEVLKGAQATLNQVALILVETNLLDLHKDVPLLAEVIVWLNGKGFVAYDICGLTRRPLDGVLWQADFIFVPQDSWLRADKRWNG